MHDWIFVDLYGLLRWTTSALWFASIRVVAGCIMSQQSVRAWWLWLWQRHNIFGCVYCWCSGFALSSGKPCSICNVMSWPWDIFTTFPCCAANNVRSHYVHFRYHFLASFWRKGRMLSLGHPATSTAVYSASGKRDWMMQAIVCFAPTMGT